jgi:dCMP deaminase
VTEQVLLYLPVIHRGYEDFLRRHAAAELLLLGSTFVAAHRSLQKDIRALTPEQARRYLASWRRGPIRIVERDGVAAAINARTLVVPDEDLMRVVVDEFDLSAGRNVIFEPTFLRWDRQWSLATKPVDFDGRVASDDQSVKLIALAAAAAESSSDWWRQVGAVATKDGKVLLTARNEHVPTEYAPYLNGDPRDNFSRGVRPDLSTAIHAEASLVGEAARRGLSLDGCDLYVTTFPCPPCARLVAAAGFSRCYFAGPYAMLDGEQVLRAAGVELVWVSTADEGAVVSPGGN